MQAVLSGLTKVALKDQHWDLAVMGSMRLADASAKIATAYGGAETANPYVALQALKLARLMHGCLEASAGPHGSSERAARIASMASALDPIAARYREAARVLAITHGADHPLVAAVHSLLHKIEAEIEGIKSPQT
jgi:hypothetical protein